MYVYRVEVIHNGDVSESQTKTFSTFDLADAYLEKYLLKRALDYGDLPEDENIEITSHTQIIFWIDYTGASYYSSSVLRAFESNKCDAALLIQEKVYEN